MIDYMIYNMYVYELMFDCTYVQLLYHLIYCILTHGDSTPKDEASAFFHLLLGAYLGVLVESPSGLNTSNTSWRRFFYWGVTLPHILLGMYVMTGRWDILISSFNHHEGFWEEGLVIFCNVWPLLDSENPVLKKIAVVLKNFQRARL